MDAEKIPELLILSDPRIIETQWDEGIDWKE